MTSAVCTRQTRNENLTQALGTDSKAQNTGQFTRSVGPVIDTLTLHGPRPNSAVACAKDLSMCVDGLYYTHKTNVVGPQVCSRQSRLKRPQSSPNPRCTPHGAEGDAQSTKFCEWLSNKAIGHLQEKADTEVKKTKKMYEAVLETEDTFVKDLDGLVQHKDLLNLRKKEVLHKNWTEHVHQPMRRQIIQQMNGAGYTELQRRKRQLHKEYLEHVNKKGHVFLDTIAPDEYYALSLHPTRPSLLVAETKHLKDPLLNQERERNNEDRTIIRCEMGSVLSDRALAQIRLPPVPLVPLGRHGTQCSTWLAMPMGDIESPVRFASRRRMHPNVNRSHFTFNSWGKPAKQTIIDEEMGIQKRRAVCPTTAKELQDPAPDVTVLTPALSAV